jgi:hypothetical protein
MNVISGLSLARDRAAPIVRSYVIRRYRDSFIPAEDTPRQKKQASYPASRSSTGVRSPRSGWTISSSFGSCRPVGVRPTVRTRSTSGSSRHSRSTPCPTIPVAPNTITFMNSA